MRKILWSGCVGVILAVILYLPAKGQYHVKTWDTSDHLSLIGGNDIVQTPKGYIWLATDGNGLLRFDGVSFTEFSRENTDAIHSDNINQLYLDEEGALWIASRGGGVVKYKNGTFIRPFDEYEINQQALSVLETDDGSIWIGTDGGGLYRFKDDSLQNFNTGNSKIPSNHIFSLAEYKGKILADQWRSATEITYDDSTLTFSPIEGIKFVSFNIKIINGYAWLCTGNGLYKYDGEEVTRYGTGGDRVSNYITDIIKDSNDTWWATSFKGLYQFNPNTGKLNPISFFEEQGRFTTIIEDRQQNIWLSPLGIGLARIKRTYFESYLDTPEIPKKVSSVQQLGDRDFVVGTESGLFRSQKGTVTKINTSGFARNTIGPLLYDNKKRLWVGFSGGGFGLLTGNRVSRVNPSSLSDQPANTLFQSENAIWLGAINTGLFRRNQNDNTVKKYDLSNGTVNAITRDSSGAVWAGTNYGLNKVTKDTVIDYLEDDGLSNAVITSLRLDDQNNLWIGTAGGGLNLYKEQQFYAFTTAEGIPARHIDQIQIDHLGFIWFGSKRGVYRISRNQLLKVANNERETVNPTYFSLIDGLPTLDFSQTASPSGTITQNKDLLFATKKGMVRVDPDRKFKRKATPEPIIETVQFNHKPVSLSEAREVPPSVNSVEIKYTAPSYKAPERMKFQYKMEPFDQSWIDAGQRRSAFYTNLPYGDYRFKVAAINLYGNRSDVTSFPVSVIPPWYLSTYAYIGYGLLFFLGIPGLVFGYNYWNTRRLEKRNRKLRSMVDERTERIEDQVAELQKQKQLRSRFFANISHEFRTPLTLIITPLENMLDGKFGTLSTDIREQSERMLKNARRVNQLTSQLLDLSRLEVGKMPRNPEHIELVQFIKSFTKEFVPLAKREQITFSFDSDPEELIIKIDQDILVKILGNLLSNAFKFTLPGNAISVKLGQNEGNATITVQDTGIGMEKEKIEQIFERFYQLDQGDTRSYEGAGIGLALVKELVDSSGGTLTADSKPNEGTSFIVQFPLTKKAETKEDRLVTKPSFLQLDNISTNSQKPNPVASLENNDNESLAEKDQPILLVVDDHPEVRDIVRQQFEDTYHILEAADGEEAYNIALEKLPDLIICDIMMPQTDGITFLKNLRKLPEISHIPVVILTAKSKETDRLDSLEKGADAYITKPFNRKELTIRVQKLIEKQQALRHRYRKKALTEAEEVETLSEEEQFILMLKEIAENNLDNPDFTASKFAKQAGFSRSQLQRRLKKTLDTTPSRFMRNYRLNRAHQLLQQESATISEIAYSVGFNSLSYFSKCFKEEFGCSPSEV